MKLKNYTTSIKIEKTISEIEQNLANIGASHIFKMYKNGIPEGIAFNLEVKGQFISFKLPMREDKILIVFKNLVRTGKIPRRYHNDIDQARRTGWRIIKHWVESQVALLQIEFAKPEEIFLPYIYDNKTDQTFFEKLEKQGFNNLLEDKS